LRDGTRAALDFFEALAPLSSATLGEFRAAMAQFARPQAENVPVEQKLIPGPRGHAVPVYVINARRGVPRPAILHVHGGGFVAGAANFDVRNQQDIAAALDCVVVTVDYRLAPEAGWQKSLGDNYAALKWLHTNAAKIGVDPERIAVMGESAGGGHAALLAIEARNREEVPLVLQLLIYPMLDDRTGSTRRVPAHVGTMVWTGEANRFGWGALLGTKPGGRDVPSNAVPARIADLTGVAPAFIGVGALDLFVDENIAYARRLSAAGVSTELHVVPGAVHGFDEFAPESSVVRQFVALKLDALRRAFGLPVG
jgi:acetyl esterase/lipase